MNSCKVVSSQHKKLIEEFETYQNFAESTMQMLNEKNTKLEKNLDALENIVEVSKYINSYVSDGNLIPMINDMMIGILGVTYSTIYLKEKDKFIIKATNINDWKNREEQDVYFKELLDGKPFIINSKSPLFEGNIVNKEPIHSLIGVPIYLRTDFTGYIVVEHARFDFFSCEHIKFISSIANQIGIALENNFLYNALKKASILDPLLGIYNRKHFFEIVDNKIIKDSTLPFAIVMVDIDDFKKVNDKYGHQFGDEALIQTIKIIERSVDALDVVARYGGEEFVICISTNNKEERIFEKIDEIRNRIGNNEIQYGNVKQNITASFGISYYPKDANTIEEVINIADTRLYNAKKTGKNKVIEL